MRTEYQVQAYGVSEKQIGNPSYSFNRHEAIAEAKQMLADDQSIVEVDLQVTYNCDDEDSELSFNVWNITRDGITKTGSDPR